jgi:hypothetical protein
VPGWAAKRAALQPDRLKLPVIPWHVRCNWCRHVRSSHLKLVVFGRCKADDCDCLCFDTYCGCDHLLSSHMWGAPREHWPCAIQGCWCRGFGAKRAADVPPEQEQLF